MLLPDCRVVQLPCWSHVPSATQRFVRWGSAQGGSCLLRFRCPAFHRSAFPESFLPRMKGFIISVSDPSHASFTSHKFGTVLWHLCERCLTCLDVGCLESGPAALSVLESTSLHKNQQHWALQPGIVFFQKWIFPRRFKRSPWREKITFTKQSPPQLCSRAVQIMSYPRSTACSERRLLRESSHRASEPNYRAAGAETQPSSSSEDPVAPRTESNF
jgi:hypothetical protein